MKNQADICQSLGAKKGVVFFSSSKTRLTRINSPHSSPLSPPPKKNTSRVIFFWVGGGGKNPHRIFFPFLQEWTVRMRRHTTWPSLPPNPPSLPPSLPLTKIENAHWEPPPLSHSPHPPTSRASSNTEFLQKKNLNYTVFWEGLISSLYNLCFFKFLAKHLPGYPVCFTRHHHHPYLPLLIPWSPIEELITYFFSWIGPLQKNCKRGPPFLLPAPPPPQKQVLGGFLVGWHS